MLAYMMRKSGVCRQAHPDNGTGDIQGQSNRKKRHGRRGRAARERKSDAPMIFCRSGLGGAPYRFRPSSRRSLHESSTGCCQLLSGHSRHGPGNSPGSGAHPCVTTSGSALWVLLHRSAFVRSKVNEALRIIGPIRNCCTYRVCLGNSTHGRIWPGRDHKPGTCEHLRRHVLPRPCPQAMKLHKPEHRMRRGLPGWQLQESDSGKA